MKLRKRMQGVTLMELMIVVTILAILVAVAYPNYREFVSRAKRTEAKAALLKIATNEERVYLQNSSYTADMTQLGFASAGPVVTDSGAYSVSVALNGAADYTAVATFLLGGAEAGKCTTFQIVGSGVRTSSPEADCWTRTR